jgi:hypothetical protein
MMHLFVVAEGSHAVFGHFHPRQNSPMHFAEVLTGLPPGEYNVFADVVLANGLSQTVTGDFVWPLDSTRAAADPDDATWRVEQGVGSTARPAPLGDGMSIVWTGDTKPLVANEPIDLRFEVRDATGKLATLAPYLGMAGHAVVLKSDESVFVHLHPMGTVSTSAQQTFLARDRGDTASNGQLLAAGIDTMSAMPMSIDPRLDFPYEFPKAGRYRVWVQVRAAGANRVLTGAFDLDIR